MVNKTHHATSAGAITGFVPTGSTRVDIWIRKVGTRRQAFYRCIAVGISTWQAMGLPLAVRALKAGNVSLPGIANGAARLHVEDETAHLIAAQFAAHAQRLNSDVDRLNAAARGAA